MALLHVVVGAPLGIWFDLPFTAICVGAALWVRPRDFFHVGVMPPLLLAGVSALFAVFDRGAMAQADDTLIQAFISGLAHHSGALAVGYGLTLAVLALRQVALRNHGTLRQPVNLRSALRPPEEQSAETSGSKVTT